MQIIDLFSGVGGFSVAGHQLGWETILFCEKEPFPQMVLRERFPGVPIFDDVCKLTGEKINGLIQSARPIILTGGFPCQPFSVAGAREGTEDDRHLWPEMFRIIKAIRPDYIIGENVPGLLSIEGGVVFEQVCLDLESEGYEVQAFVLPACATGAPHRRDRVWIVAYTNNTGRGSGFGSVRSENGKVFEWNENAELGNTNSGVISDTNESSKQCSPRIIRKEYPFISNNGEEWTTSDTNKIGINRCSQTGSNEGEQPEDSEQPGSGWTGKTGGYVGKWDASNPEQKRCGGRCDTNSITEEWQIYQNLGHNGNGVWGKVEGCGKCTLKNPGSSGCNDGEYDKQGNIGNFRELSTGGDEWDANAEDDSDPGIQGHKGSKQSGTPGAYRPIAELYSGSYWHNWPSISPFHSGYDGLSPELVRHIRTSLAEAGETVENIEAYIRKEANWIRKQGIMAAGNAVVPQVVLQIMKAIQYHHENTND